jgi:hypothetical protein
MRRFITAAIAAAAMALAGASGYALHGTPHGTYCPAEDSCAYSYAHHAGTVVRVTP